MSADKRPDSEINYRDLIKNPVRLFGIIYPYFGGLITLLGVFYILNLDAISLNKFTASTDTVAVQDIQLKKGGMMPAIDLNSVKTSTPELVSAGRESYSKNCTSCHGETGLGNGVAGAALNPKPRNFTLAENWTNGTDFQMIFKTLQEGIPKNGMAAYEYLPVEERFAIIHFIRSLSDHFPKIEDEQIASLDKTYRLSEDVYVPHQIPVKLSRKLIAEEYFTATDVNILKEKLSALKNEKGFGILNKVSYDPVKVVMTFKNIPSNNFSKKLFYNNLKDSGLNTKVLELSENELKLLKDFITKL